MDEQYEQAYLQGERTVWTQLLRECLKNLGQEERDKFGWIAERESAIASLREICAEFGDNDWTEELHLRDILDKHLASHLFS